MNFDQIAQLLHDFVRRFVGGAIEELVRELLAAFAEIQRALAASVLDAALVAGAAGLIFILAVGVIRSLGRLRVARRDAEAEQPPPGFARLLR